MPMKEPFSDTTPEANRVLLALLRQAPVWRKLQMLGQVNEMTQTLALSGLRQQFPDAPEAALRRLLADRVLGVELATAVYGPHIKQETTNDAV